ncbi:hypothetical protein BT96DRAFT_952186, partial [Gymnopus androsaceus JB14]
HPPDSRLSVLGSVARNNSDGLPVFKVKEVQSSRNSEQSLLVLDEFRQRVSVTTLLRQSARVHEARSEHAHYRSRKIDENGNRATFIHTSPPGITTTKGPGATCELKLETFRSAWSISATASQQLRCYFVSNCVFPDSPATKDAEGRNVSDKSFLEKASGKRSCGALSNVPSPISTTFTLYSAPKHVEQLSNGVIIIISLYVNPVPNSNAPPIKHSIFQVMKEASLLFCLPENPFFLPKAP